MILAAIQTPPDRKNGPGEDLRSDRDIPAGIRYDADLAVHEPMQVPDAPAEPSAGRLPLLVFPLGLLALCLVVYLLFGLIAEEGKKPSEYLDTIRLGRADAWQAAYELSRLVAEEDPAERDPRLLPRIVALLEGSEGTDERVRRYLILSLGRLGDSRGVDTLVAALADPDPQSRLYTIWGLGAIGDRRAAAALLPLLEDGDPEVRKMTAYTLGALPAPEVPRALQAMLHDPIPDVAWNAALSLARLGDPAGLPLIGRLIDRAYLDTVRTPDPSGGGLLLSEGRKEEIMISALRALARLRGEGRRSAIGAIAASDPSLSVRQAALETLARIDSTNP
jgi:HEAT repeat protein